MGLQVLVFVVLSALLITAHCSESQEFEKVQESRNRAGKSEFEYDDVNGHGPEHWASISPDYAICKKGNHQSPINLNTSNTTSTGMMPEVKLFESVVEYAPSGANFALKCLGAPGGEHCSTIIYNNEVYHMVQAHFHSPSEHHINGVDYPLEMHLVHTREDGKALLVLGVLFSLGDFNYDVQKLLDAADEQDKQVVDFPHFVQPGAGLCTYEGSLTTPPCTEGVHWLISNTDVRVSLKQVGQYREMVGEKTNNRPVQVVSDPQARCYPDPKLTGGIAKRPRRTSLTSQSSKPTQSSSATSASPNASPRAISESEMSNSDEMHTSKSPTGSEHSGSKDSAEKDSDNSSSGTLDTSTPRKSGQGATESVETEDSSTGILSNSTGASEASPQSNTKTLASPVPLTPGSSSSSCFPADAKVIRSDGKMLRMDELQIGDEVSIGGGNFSRVFLFTHRDETKVTTHVHITFSSRKTLTLSPGHNLLVNGKIIAAHMVRVGDKLDGENGRTETVAHLSSKRVVGLFNPHTVSGNIAVNGIVCSTYTTALVRPVAHAFLAPIRSMFLLGFLSEDNTGKLFSHGVGF